MQPSQFAAEAKKIMNAFLDEFGDIPADSPIAPLVHQLVVESFRQHVQSIQARETMQAQFAMVQQFQRGQGGRPPQAVVIPPPPAENPVQPADGPPGAKNDRPHEP